MATTVQTQSIFFGQYRHALDAKNRITIPSRWRKSEADEFFLVPDQNNACILALPPEEFQKVEETVTNHPGITPQERRVFIRQFYALAQNCFADKQGRLLLPEEHCKRVGLERDVMITGSLSRFEIWDVKRWEENFDAGNATYRKVADVAGL